MDAALCILDQAPDGPPDEGDERFDTPGTSPGRRKSRETALEPKQPKDDRFMSRARPDQKPMEPEPIDGSERAMNGFLATLTPEQQARILAYRDPENHGNPKFVAT